MDTAEPTAPAEPTLSAGPKAPARPTVPAEAAAAKPSGEEWEAGTLDLDAYLRRIGYDGPRSATAGTLHRMHRAHMSAIRFENLDLFLGRGLPLDMAALQAKLVHAERGGYCFEQNLLFAAALERVGFPVTRHLARVRRGSTKIRYRSHAALLVEAGGERWLADVGFGDEGLIEPIAFRDGARLGVGDWTWRLDHDGDEWVLRSLHPDGWFDVYAMRLERHFRTDFDVAHHYTATHPRSTFVGKLVAQRGDERVRQTLLNRELVTRRADGRTERTELAPEDVPRVLADAFGLRVGAADERLLRDRLTSRENGAGATDHGPPATAR